MDEFGLTRRRLLAATGMAVTAGLAGCNAPTTDSTAVATDDGAESDEQTPTAADSTPEPAASVYTRVYRQTIDSVVLVDADVGQGTGFVFDDGHVVTNAHVVGDSDTADVRFHDGTWNTGPVVGADVYSDLAVIRVDDSPAAATPLSFVDEATIGQEVVVIGNPFGLSGTVTAGIVSGVNRSIPSPAGYSIPDAVQTDAAVNPGNSGGPIVSLDGDVVAVINSGGGDNVAFGISATLTQRVVGDLVAEGTYDHSYMGVSLSEVTPAVAEANGLDTPRGILVVDVRPDGPSSGVLRGSDERTTVDGQRVPVGGDVILAMDGTTLRTLEDLSSYLALETRPDDTVAVTLLRDGRERTVDLTLGVRPRP